ncbi:MAG: hypothetical protein M3088_06455, partial [Actinomycetota bacterium]|nr:hypothetical protein [Actinomycetota bacterium]
MSGAVAAVAVAVLAGCGEGADPKAPRIDAFSPVEQRVGDAQEPRRASPRWAPVASMAGRGPATKTVSIDDDAIQWRVRWRCRSGPLRVFTAPEGAGRRLLEQGRCPGRGEAESVGSGRVRVDVEAAGPWKAVVEQQVDSPIAEPPLPAMRARAARVVAHGDIYRIERRGRGEAQLH